MSSIERILTRPPDGWSQEDLCALLSAPPEAQPELAAAAAEKTRRRHGEIVTFVVNRNVNFSNQCSVRCLFCAFHRSPRHPEAFRLTPEQIVENIADTPWITEVCIQGAIDELIDLSFYVELVQTLKHWKPTLHIHAFSPQELHSLATRENRPVADIVTTLVAAGLDSIPGTAAEILDDYVRKLVSPRRLSAAEWRSVIETAHGLGVRSSATMMFGHLERIPDRAAHLRFIRDIQERTGGFTEFVPMPFVPGNTALDRAGFLRREPEPSTDWERIVAVSRLYFDDVIPNVQASWVKLGVERAAKALHAGANDLGGTLFEENITRTAGGEFGTVMLPEDFRRAAHSVGLQAVQRTTLYEVM